MLSGAASRIERRGLLVPTVALERPVDLPGLFGVTATEGTVFPKMTDLDGSVPDTAPERMPN